MTKSGKETLLSIADEIDAEFEKIRHWLAADYLTDKRRKMLLGYEETLIKILRRLKTEEFSSQVIREQIEEAKREFKI